MGGGRKGVCIYLRVIQGWDEHCLECHVYDTDVYCLDRLTKFAVLVIVDIWNQINLLPFTRLPTSPFPCPVRPN